MKRKTLSPGTMLNNYKIQSDVEQDSFSASYIVSSGEDGPQQKRFLIREFFPAFLSSRRSGHVALSRKDKADEFRRAKAECTDIYSRLEKLDHDCLVSVLDHFEAKNTCCIVSEWPNGETLSEIVQSYGPLNAENLRSLFDVILPGLSALEEGGLVHGGISPDSIFRREDGLPVLNTPTFPCLDGRSLIVPWGKMPASPYLPPEYLAEPAQTIITPSADVYSLGVTSAFLLTGTAPPVAEARQSAISAGEADPLDLEGLKTACGDDDTLFGMLQSCLALDPIERPAGFGVLVESLVTPEPEIPEPSVFENPVPEDEVPVLLTAQRVKLVMGVAAGLVAALALFLIMPGYLPPESWKSAKVDPTPAPTPTQTPTTTADLKAGTETVVSPLPTPTPTPTETPPPEIDPVEQAAKLAEERFLKDEAAAWQAAETGGTAEAYRVYLAVYGGEADKLGPHAEDAELKLAALLKAAEKSPAPEPPIEDETIKVGTPFRDCENCPEMVLLPTGSFQMGAKDDEAGSTTSERPVRTVRISKKIALSTHEITLAEYRHYLNETGESASTLCSVQSDDRAAYWSLQPGKSVDDPGYAITPQHPAVCLSWKEANFYAQWLSLITGEIYRLPTEAEWEYAARGGRQTVWPWGNSRDHACAASNGADQSLDRATGPDWFTSDCRDGQAYAALVGQYSPNGFGLYDMSGNVLEWVQDCRTADYSSATSAPESAKGGECRFRGVRGGSWASSPEQLRSAKRHFMPETVRYNTIGIRLVREVQ